KIAAHDKSKLAFHTEQSARDAKRRSALQHVLAYDRRIDRFMAAQEPLHLNARRANLATARHPAERTDCGRLKRLGFSAAREFVQGKEGDRSAPTALGQCYRAADSKGVLHATSLAVASATLLTLLRRTVIRRGCRSGRQVRRAMSVIGTSRHFAAVPKFRRYWR